MGLDTFDMIQQIESKRKASQNQVAMDGEVDMEHLLDLVDKDVEKEKLENSKLNDTVVALEKNPKKRLLSDISSLKVSSNKRSSILKRGNDSNLMVDNQDDADVEFLVTANLKSDGPRIKLF